MKFKSDFFNCFLEFQSFVENQFDRRIKVFQSDGGGEFQSRSFKNYLAKCGILHQISCPHTPEQNGVAERKHRHMVETGLTLLYQPNLPQNLWVDAFLTVVRLINRMSSTVLKKKSPFFQLYNKQLMVVEANKNKFLL